MKIDDSWDSGLPYEPFMGRWSRKIAPVFLEWLNAPDGLRWLDVGCGTGALSLFIAANSRPKEVLGIDPSEAFVAYAANAAKQLPGVHFEVADAEHIPAADDYFETSVSALALNFFPDPAAGLQEMIRVVKPGGEIAIYVWDYAEGMQMLRTFWDVVVAQDPTAVSLDEKSRFPICQPMALEALFTEAGLLVNDIQALEAPAIFESFDDYWQPFLGGVGPAPGYVSSINSDQNRALVSALKAALPVQPDGTIPLSARAWAIKAYVQEDV